MTTAGVESVAGPSHGNSHVIQMMTSQSHLQPTTVCLPVSVQHLSYDDDDFVDDDDDDDELQSINMNSEADHAASTSANVSQSTPVRSQLLNLLPCYCCDSPAALLLSLVIASCPG